MNRVNNFVRKYLKPFWFSSNSDKINVPYVYGTILMGLFFSCVLLFAFMAYKCYPAGVLGSFAGVIATLAGLYFGTLNIYNKGTQVKAQIAGRETNNSLSDVDAQ